MVVHKKVNIYFRQIKPHLHCKDQ